MEWRNLRKIQMRDLRRNQEKQASKINVDVITDIGKLIEMEEQTKKA